MICLWFAVHVICLEPIQFTWGYNYHALKCTRIYTSHTEVDRCISKICKVDWLLCYKIICTVSLSQTLTFSFALHSCPPHITGASVRSCAGPSILTGAGTQCCVGSNERTRLQLLITVLYLRRDTYVNLIVKCNSFMQGLHCILTRAFMTLYSIKF